MVRRGMTGERLWALFFLGLVLLLPPLIGVFDKAVLVGGIPLLYLFLFAAWAGLIALTALVMELPTAGDDGVDGEPRDLGASTDGTAATAPGGTGTPGA